MWFSLGMFLVIDSLEGFAGLGGEVVVGVGVVKREIGE